jgi:hypothetical protein
MAYTVGVPHTYTKACKRSTIRTALLYKYRARYVETPALLVYRAELLSGRNVFEVVHA